MTEEKELTHWLQNPNKSYLGHQDLPNGEDVILTILSAKWEEVKNPILNTTEAKRIIRFTEQNSWVKPFICNEINAKTIFKITGEKYMEKCKGSKIKIGISQTKVKKEEVDCLRVRAVSPESLAGNKVSVDQAMELEDLIEAAGRNKKDWCESVKVSCVADVPAAKFASFKKRLNEIVEQKK